MHAVSTDSNQIAGELPDVLPSELETLEPGLFLAAVVSSVDRSRLSDHDAVRLLTARDRLVSHLQAERAADIAEVAGRSSDDPHGDFAALEVGAALRLTGMAAKHEVALARDLGERLPQAGSLLNAGQIDVRRAKVLVDGTAHLPQEAARRVVAEVADRAPVMTTGQLRALLRRRCIVANPDDAKIQMDHAIAQRRLVIEATARGTAHLHLLDLPPDLAQAAWERIDVLAGALSKDDRTIDQRRADVALDLVCGQGRPVGRGVVDVTVDLRTLLGLAESPGDLGGLGPVVADIARQVVDRQVDCRWQATVIDDNGDPLAVALRRRPTASQARQVRARYRRCIFPGCRRPARQSQIDHSVRHADGGPTLERNLAPLCLGHHLAKDRGGWQYHRLPNGDHRWISPFGHVYITSGQSP